MGRSIKVLEGPEANRPWLTIVGVVANEKHQDFFHPMSWVNPPIVYRPVYQDPPSRAFVVCRTLTDNGAAAKNLQDQLDKLDSNVPVTNVETMNDRLSKALSYPRLRAVVLVIFAVVSLLMAAVGLYAVLSQAIVQRTQEFGIRMALGAYRSDLLKLVIGEGMLLTCTGVAASLLPCFYRGRSGP